MNNLTPELIAKAKAAKSAEELLDLAKANNVALTEEEAKSCFAQLNANGAVSDDELDIVAGGLGCPNDGEDSEEDSSATSPENGITGRCSQCGCTEIVFQMYLGSKIYKCKKCNATVTNVIESRAL